MKRTRQRLLVLLNGYHAWLAAYLLLRSLFGGAWWWLALLNTFALYAFLPLLLTASLGALLRGKRTTAVALLLGLIGLVFFVPLPKLPPPNGAQPGERSLRVVQFNIYEANGQFQQAVQWLLAQDADVLVLQEITAEHYDPRLQPVHDAYPHHAYIQGSVRLFSRHPIQESDWRWIEPPGRTHGRLVLRARLDVAGQPLVVYGVHLSLPWTHEPHLPLHTDNFYLNMLLRYDETRRNAQIQGLIAAVQQEPYPVVVAGDFNMSHTSTIYRAFQEAGLRDAYRDAGRGWGLSWPTGGLLPPLLRIDYVWHTSDLRALRARLGTYQGSDHLPLIVDVALPD